MTPLDGGTASAAGSSAQLCQWPNGTAKPAATAERPEVAEALGSWDAFAKEPQSKPARKTVAQVDVASSTKEHVKAKVFLSLDKLPAGGKCKFVVILDVQDGWHINANPPRPDNMIATKVTIQAKQKSKQLETIYPEGSELTMEDLDEPVSVYEGQVLIRGEIQAPADAAGKTEEMEFQIKYQACNEKTCLPPKSLKLAGKIDIVKAGTPVKPVNQKYFPAK